MLVDAASQEVLHQAGLDALLFSDDGFGLLDGLVDDGEDSCQGS